MTITYYGWTGRLGSKLIDQLIVTRAPGQRPQQQATGVTYKTVKAATADVGALNAKIAADMGLMAKHRAEGIL